MTLEISDCTPACLEWDTDKTLSNFSPSVSKGLLQIPDSIEMRRRPHFMERMVIQISILLLYSITWTFQISNWVLKTFFGLYNRQKALYQQLHQISRKGDMEQIVNFLKTHARGQYEASYLFAELQSLPELYPYLSEILQGANVSLCDGGFFCKHWSAHPNARQRISSHNYQRNECYGIGHFLFWLDGSGNTRFQFEKSPLKGFFSSLDHMFDYLHYRRDYEQQGIVGSSLYTEWYPLEIPINPTDFLCRKETYNAIRYKKVSLL